MTSTIFSSQSKFQKIIPLIEAICKANNVDDTHGLAHALKIASQTEKALQLNKVEDAQLYENLIYAALLHDIDDYKYFKTQNYANAVSVLKNACLPQERIAKIIDMIGLVSFSKNGNSINSQVPISYYLPRYVDRSEAIGLQGLHRSLIYSLQKANQTPIYCENTPKPQNENQLRSVSQGRDIEYMKRGGCSASVVDHVFDKLIHIKLPSQIKNEYLIDLYQKKYSQMVEFVLKHAKTGYIDYEKELLEQYKRNGKQWEYIE